MEMSVRERALKMGELARAKVAEDLKRLALIHEEEAAERGEAELQRPTAAAEFQFSA